MVNQYKTWKEFIDSGDYKNLPINAQETLEVIAETSGEKAVLLTINTSFESFGTDYLGGLIRDAYNIANNIQSLQP